VRSAGFNKIKENFQTMTLQDSTISQKLAFLKKSKFRSKFKLSQKDRSYIATKGLETIKDHAFQFINSRVAPDFPKNDGKQTPMRGHPVFIAQHATATCCRGCILKWHGIEKGRALNEKKVDYVEWRELTPLPFCHAVSSVFFRILYLGLLGVTF
jgi:hypothetical protein